MAHHALEQIAGLRISFGCLHGEFPRKIFKELTNLDQLKLRSSYGKENNNIGNYTHLSTINPTEYIFNNNIASASTISLSNPYLGWEVFPVRFWNHVNMFKNRLIFTGDLYRKETSNMLLNDYIPTITGFSTNIRIKAV